MIKLLVHMLLLVVNMVQFDESFSNSQVKELRTKEEERTIQSKAPQLGFPYLDLKSITLHPEALSVIPEARSRQAMVAGFDLNQQKLSLAAQNPVLKETQDLIKELEARRYKVSVFMCSSASLEHAWKRYADVRNTSSEKQGTLTIDSIETQKLIEEIKKRSDVSDLLKQIGTANNASRISETLSLIFAGALALKASDIHIEPEELAIRLRYRLDGVLHDVVDLDSYIYKRLMSRLKLLSGMTLNVRAEAQDGRFTFDSGPREVEVRASIIPGSFGESVVMRILDPTVSSFSLSSINLNPHIEAVLVKELKKPNGLIITTGPTGSGKTTALYAFLREVHDEAKKIITIENPVEYKIEGIVHTQTDENYTFAKGLRAVLRQDPDVIMVGEIRDREVAETAMHAAQTGHLVFSTLHTNSAIAGFTRLIDLGINPNVMGSSINMLLGQRLVRRLCEKCKVSYQASAEEVDLIKKVMADHPYPTEIGEVVTLHRASGCEACAGTGFRGRLGVFEGILMDDKVEEVVIRDPREHAIKEAARAQKIPTMLEDGIDKVLIGITSLFELERVVEFPESLNLQTPTVTTPEEVEGDKTKPTKNSSKLDDEFKSHII